MRNTTKVLKEANEYLVAQCIISYQPITIEEIVRKTSISRPTVLKVIKELMGSGYFVKQGQERTTGGRPADLMALNPDVCYAVGVDLEFPMARIAITNAIKEIMASTEIKYEMEASVDEILDSLIDGISDVIRQAGVNSEEIIGIGIGLPGNIDARNGISTHIERIRDWHNIHIKELFEQRFQIPVYIKNDVHFMAIAEREKYMVSTIQDFIYVGLRSGIGSAIFCKGKSLEGKNGNAGFIGHTVVNPNGPLCTCGNYGCLDAFSSEIAMNKEYKARLAKAGRAKKSDIKYQRIRDFINKAEMGEEISRDILKQSGFHIGIAIANMINILEITTVIIGGCTQIEDTEFVNEIKNTVRRYFAEKYDKEIDIRIGSLKKEEYPLGACCFVLGHMFEKPALSLKA